MATTSGKVWTVSPTGTWGGAGTTLSPMSLDRALSIVSAGDTIVLQDGSYSGPFSLSRSGSPGHYITLRAANTGMARLSVAGIYSALALDSVSWIRIEGLNLQATKDHGLQTENCHHIQLVNNICHDCGGAGIALNYGDYYLVEGNTIYNNCKTNTYQTSGISIYQARAIYDAGTDFRIIIRRNMVYANSESSSIAGNHTEGHGIILDDFHNTQNGSMAGNYTGKTLVENNLVTNNGGDGILAYESDNATVRHNTVAFNNTDAGNTETWRGELSNSNGRNNLWYNNIATCDSSIRIYNNAVLDGVTGGFQNTGVQWIGNLLYNISKPADDAVLVQGDASTTNHSTTALTSGNNLLSTPPGFAQTPVGGNASTFKLALGSAAVNAARAAYANTVDYNNKPRGSQPDIGALEY